MTQSELRLENSQLVEQDFSISLSSLPVPRVLVLSECHLLDSRLRHHLTEPFQIWLLGSEDLVAD